MSTPVANDPEAAAALTDLGMNRPIPRRDFLNGAALALGTSLLPWQAVLATESDGDSAVPPPGFGSDASLANALYYPPALTGLRGSHPGSFEAAHALRDGEHWSAATDEDDAYDLIVVGAGISGLAAAHFFRKASGPDARILLVDNHDDFGGHAQRNEFRVGERLLLGYGGTQSMEAPGRYSPVAKGLLQELGIDVQRFYRYFDSKLYRKRHLSPSIFFDRQAFGVDRLLVAADGVTNGATLEAFGPIAYLTKHVIARMPIAKQARKDLARLLRESVDYLPEMNSEQKRSKLSKTSYQDFLLLHAYVHPDVVRVLQTSTHDLYCVGIDAVSANDCRLMGFPGFLGMTVAASLQAAEEGEEEPYIFHFPDGNASIARLLVRTLIPGSAPGTTMEDIVTARLDYGKLDVPASRVRLRLNSTAVRVAEVGSPGSKEVSVTYVREGKAHRVRGARCVLACYNMIIPHLCPQLPESQKAALSYAVKQPLVYVNVQLRNSQAFDKLGTHWVHAPASYFTMVMLDFPVSIGDYHFPASPQDPCVIHLTRTPCKPGLACKEQFRAGRAELLATSFETFEREIRQQLNSMLGSGGFDAARDIQAITVNRWPHGYAYEYNQLFEPLDQPDDERPCVIGRKPFGRIAIANSDSDGHAYTNTAIDQAHRAITELL